MSRKPINVELGGSTGVRLSDDKVYKVNIGMFILNPSKSLEDRTVQLDMTSANARGLAKQLLELADKADRYTSGNYAE